jgi:hypothetical protein
VARASQKAKSAAASDTELLDWLDRVGASNETSRPWVCRRATSGRGYRLHQMDDSSVKFWNMEAEVDDNVRDAIRRAIAQEQA